MRTLLASRCGILIEIEIRNVYADAGFHQEIVGWKIDGDHLAALDALNDWFPRGDPKTLKLTALLLMAKTNRAKSSIEMDALRLSDFIRIMSEYPIGVCQKVVDEWDQREGDEAIFTPASAELRRALDDECRVLQSLRRALVSRGTVTS